MMTLKEAIEQRHSVRSYTDRKIEGETLAGLTKLIEEINKEADLHIQLVTEEPKAFSGALAKYGRFTGVRNYIALVGKKSEDLYEKCGYYGERIVLFAQQLGLNTCWVALTFRKVPGVFEVGKNEKLVMVIAVGYGENQGYAHKSKPLGDLYTAITAEPQWFMDGVRAASLAPTAMNQQKFRFEYDDGKVSVKALRGPYSSTDLGIVKYHFEIGSGRKI
ncbi:MAG: nitroreductase family protein [Erysipelotrichaceae bacterium]|nr:nitroreductase family protein [Erysipelotrichaceae bacterium]